MQIDFRRTQIAVFVFFILSSGVSSQTYSNKESSILSFSVGLTNSNLINSPTHYKSGTLCNAGLVYNLMLTERFNAGIELLYTGKAFKNDSPIIKYRYFYADIPLYLQVNLSNSIRINAGAQYSIATNSLMATIDPSNANGVHQGKIAAIKPVDYGFLAGIEIDVSKQLALGARYTLSGSTFFEKDAVNFGVFQFSIKYSPVRTYRVFFGKKGAQEQH